jgi:hypothetical protein
MTTDSSPDMNPTVSDGSVSEPAHPPRWRRLLVGLGAINVLVVGFSLTAPLLTAQAPDRNMFSAYFDANSEGSFPAWWAVAQLAAATVTLLFAALLSRREHVRGSAAWWILAGLVFLLCLDEGTRLRERLHGLVQQFVADADLGIVWLVLGMFIAALVLVMAFISARHLPEASTRLIVLGVTTLLFAAVGLEFVAGEFVRLGAPDVTLTMLHHLKELMELAAGSLLLVAPLPALRLRNHGRSTSFILLDRSRG